MPQMLMVTSAVSRLKSSRRLLLAICAFGLLTACQSTNPEDLLSPAVPPAAGPVETEKIGGGGTRIAMLVPRGAGGTAAGDAREYRDGAALAMSDLGDTHVTLTVLDTGGEVGKAGEALKQALSEGAALVLGPANIAELDAAAKVRPRNLPPILAFVDGAAPRGPNVFALRSDEVDGALAATTHAKAAGAREILVLMPRGMPASATARLKAGIANGGGSMLGPVVFDGPQALISAAGDVARAQAVMILAGADPVAAIAALRNAGLRSNALVLGTANWTRAHQTNAALSGALVPVPDQSGLRQVNERMQAAYGRPLTNEAAHAYDAVALAAGIVRALGPDGLSSSILTQPTGFRGTTGAFRFAADGTVSRLYSIYRTSPGGLRLVSDAAQGF